MKSESAVSPVIGTILLVAIAVVLVAIILAVVMGFSGDPNEKKVGLNAKAESGANATLILYGGASIDELIKLEMIDQGSPNGMYVPLWKKDSDTVFVGLPYLAEGVARPEQSMAVYDTRINVRGTFSDGTEVILLVQPMTFYDVEGTGSSDVTPEPEPAAKLSDYFTDILIGAYTTTGFTYHTNPITFSKLQSGGALTLGKDYAKPEPELGFTVSASSTNPQGRTPTKLYVEAGTFTKDVDGISFSLTKSTIGSLDASGRLETEILIMLSDDAGEIVRFTWPLIVDKNVEAAVTVG